MVKSQVSENFANMNESHFGRLTRECFFSFFKQTVVLTMSKNDKAAIPQLATSSFTDFLEPWLAESLGSSALGYVHPLPIQAIVMPYVCATLDTVLPADVCLTAPTGAGKTLCYLGPLIQAIARARARESLGDSGRFCVTRLRGVILAPTAALVDQIGRVASSIIKATNEIFESSTNYSDVAAAAGEIRIGVLGGSGADAQPFRLVGPLCDGRRLVYPAYDILIATPPKFFRCVVLPISSGLMVDSRQPDVVFLRSESVASAQCTEGYVNRLLTAPFLNHTSSSQQSSGVLSAFVDCSTSAVAAVLLGHVQQLIVDEADAALRGTHGNTVSRVAVALAAAVRLRAFRNPHANTNIHVEGPVPYMANDCVGSDGGVLRRLLCSATLTPHVANVAEVKLHNAQHFCLDAAGERLGGEQRANVMGIVQSTLAMPSALTEHMVIVRHEHQRPAVLINVLFHAIASHILPEVHENSGAHFEGQRKSRRGVEAVPSVLIFCGSAEIARVIGHLLSGLSESGHTTEAATKRLNSGKEAAIVDHKQMNVVFNVLECTHVASAEERRLALLGVYQSNSVVTTPQQSADGVTFLSTTVTVPIIVATDSMMRGIDLPGVRAVIMYDAPAGLPQYVHRVGRTARAGMPGDAYSLLSREGIDGTQEAGEVAKFRAFDALLKRTQKVQSDVALRECDYVVDIVNRYVQHAQVILQAHGWASARDTASKSVPQHDMGARQRTKRAR